VRKERAARLRAAGQRRLEAFLQAQVGTRRRSLVERQGTGHTDQFAPIRVAAAPPAGTIALLTILGVEDGVLLA
jgi:threonylcarbamoyladenosine tRNA methylthiotransferase MtaB